MGCFPPRRAKIARRATRSGQACRPRYRAGKQALPLAFGARAQNWLWQEESYRAFGSELGRDATPLEADLPRFVDLSKDFHGKAALEKTGVRSKCVTRLIDGPADADPLGAVEALYEAKSRVGRLTSGGYLVAFGKSIGLGYVTPALGRVGAKLKVRMFTKLWDAQVVENSSYDPSNARIRIDA